MYKYGIIKLQYNRLFEVVNFVATTRRWQDRGNPSRCRRVLRLPNNQMPKDYGNVVLHYSPSPFLTENL